MKEILFLKHWMINNTGDQLEVLGSDEEASLGALVHAPSYSCLSSVLGYTLEQSIGKAVSVQLPLL